MKRFILIFLFFPFICVSQDIVWKNAEKSKLFPNTIKIKGVIEFKSGLISPYNDLYVDQKNKFVYYSDENSRTAFKIYDDEILSISNLEDENLSISLGGILPLGEYRALKNGVRVKISQIFEEFSNDFFGSIRKEIYEEVDLNKFKITSVIKKPTFIITSLKELDVFNKIVVSAKILSLRPNSIEFIDSEGNIVRQNTNKVTMIEGGDDKLNRKMSRKKIRIINIDFNNEVFIEIDELYAYFYKEYRKRYYEDLINFKESFISKNFNNVLKDWGPFTDKFLLSNDKTMYTWSFPQKYSESELVVKSSSSTLSSSSSTSNTSINATLSSQYGINTNSQVRVSGYQGVINSYSSVRGNSFLKYYSSNVKNQYSVSTSSFNSKQKGSEIEIDITKKISLIVDKDDNIVEVLEKNFFQEPYFGILIKFYE